MSGVTTSSLSLAWSLRNWVILDYEEANGLTIRPWAPFLLFHFFYLVLRRCPLDRKWPGCQSSSLPSRVARFTNRSMMRAYLFLFKSDGKTDKNEEAPERKDNWLLAMDCWSSVSRSLSLESWRQEPDRFQWIKTQAPEDGTVVNSQARAKDG